MVVSITGLGSQLALNLIDSTRDRQLETLRNDPIHERGAEAFRERIGSITTPEELVKDYEVYSFVMKAFDLEDQIFGKGLIRKMLESDPSADDSLVTRLVDERFKELHASLGFTTEDGPQIPNFNNTDWQDAIVDRYFDRVFVNENALQNETVGNVLEFREKVGEIDNWYEVLKNPALTEFFQTALNLPSEISGLDIDQQVEILKDKFDLTKLSDPEEQQRMISRYIAISDVVNPPTAATSGALQILSGQYLSATIDIEPVNFSRHLLYR